MGGREEWEDWQRRWSTPYISHAHNLFIILLLFIFVFLVLLVFILLIRNSRCVSLTGKSVHSIHFILILVGIIIIVCFGEIRRRMLRYQTLWPAVIMLSRWR